MILNLIAIVVSTLNFIAFFFAMIGWDDIRAFFIKQSRRRKGIFFFVTFLAAVVLNWMRFYILFFFLFEYAIVLLWEFLQGKKGYGLALKGIVNLAVVTLTGLAIYGFSYYRLNSSYYVSEVRWEGLSIVCSLAMLIMEYFLGIVWDMDQLKKKMGRIGILFFIGKGIENVLLIYLAMVSIAFDDRYRIAICCILASIVFEYPLFLYFMAKPGLKLEKRSAENMVNYYEYYLNMEEEHRQIRKLYHEMKNKFMIMQEAGKKDPGIEALQDAIDEIDQKRITFHTGCVALDALLFDVKRKAEEVEIEFEAVIKEGCLSFMDTDDITTIFRNACLNALEACRRIEGKERWIRIKAGENGGSTIIYIKNSASSDRQQGNLQTIKADKKMHGIGLTTIRECVESYGGYLSVIEDENSFQLAMLFSVGGVKKNEDN